MTLPLVSIVIPCFQVWKYLNEALQSVFNQSYPAMEIWVVNDGCTTEAAIRAFNELKKNPRIHCLSIEQAGPSVARNAAITQAKGKYIVCLDADDLLHPEYIDRSVRVLEDDSRIGLVAPQIRLFGDLNAAPFEQTFSIGSFLIDNYLVVSSMFRREDWKTIGGFDQDLRLAEDYDFFHGILRLGRTIWLHNDVPFYYRRHEFSTSSQINFQQSLAARRYIFNKHRELYIEHLDRILDEAFKSRRENMEQKSTIDWLNVMLRGSLPLPEPNAIVSPTQQQMG